MLILIDALIVLIMLVGNVMSVLKIVYHVIPLRTGNKSQTNLEVVIAKMDTIMLMPMMHAQNALLDVQIVVLILEIVTLAILIITS